MGLTKNTIRLIAEFTSFSGTLDDPSNITLTIDEQNTGVSLKSLTIADIIRDSLGSYHYDYTVPKGVGNLIYEWSGTMDGSPIVNRGLISREWLRL